MSKSLIKSYYYLAKPGIVYGNSLAAIGGFFLASRGYVDVYLFVGMLIGIAGIIASACVVNNYIDRGIDAKMKRTEKRALVTGDIPASYALTYATVLGAIGVTSLLLVNTLALGFAILGFFFYVVVYGYWKRRSSLGTVIGSISGAVPPVVGYTAASGIFDTGALLLFAILVCWQMPHFYAIAIYRAREYKAAGIPVLPLVHGNKRTKYYIMAYIVTFAASSALLTITGYTGYTYFAVMLALSLLWIVRGLRGLHTSDDDAWARKMFGTSLIVLLGFCIAIALNAWLP